MIMTALSRFSAGLRGGGKNQQPATARRQLAAIANHPPAAGGKEGQFPEVAPEAGRISVRHGIFVTYG
jgi:hypothetical protein